MHAHSGSIWDLDFLPSSAAQGADCFVTCGADSTVRLWGLPPHENSKNTLADDEAARKPAPFKDLRAMAVCADPHVAGGAADGAHALRREALLDCGSASGYIITRPARGRISTSTAPFGILSCSPLI